MLRAFAGNTNDDTDDAAADAEGCCAVANERFDGDALGLRLRVDLLLLLARYDDDDWLGPD